MEPFGSEERNWTGEEKEFITRFLKYDRHVPLKIAEMVFSAEVEAEYFKKVGVVMGALTFGIFFYFPIVRQQPFLRRALVAAVPGFYCYNWGQTTHEQAQWLKVYGAYQRWVQYHGQHPKLFI